MPEVIGKERFKHVSYLWDDEKAAALGDDQVALLIYRSNLLGADLRLTNYGGGNTSWNAAHRSRGCSQEQLKGTGGDGLFYCFAEK